MPLFGWKASPEQFGPMELLEGAIAAEQAGFDSIDVSDHFHPWSEAGQAAFTWTWLGAAAARTGHIRLGTGLTCPILRYHPAIIAQAAATLACMAPDRVYLGLGTGEALNEYSATGHWPEYDTRQSMLREAIQLMRELWTGNDVTFEGDYYSTRKARLYTLPEHPVPIYISSLVPDSAGFAGEYGDGLMTTGGENEQHYRALFQAFDEGARRAGKDPARMPRHIEISVGYAEDIDEVINNVKKYWAGTFIPALFTEKIYTARMSAKNGEAVGEEAIRKGGCFSSDPREHVKYVQRYIDWGFTELYFHYAGNDQKEFLERYARDVLPGLAKKSSKA